MDTATIASKGFIQRLFIVKSLLKDKYLKYLEAVIESPLCLSTIQKVRVLTHWRQSIELNISYSSSSGQGWGIEFSYMDTVKVEKWFLTKQSVKDNISQFAESIIQK